MDWFSTSTIRRVRFEMSQTSRKLNPLYIVKSDFTSTLLRMAMESQLHLFFYYWYLYQFEIFKKYVIFEIFEIF